MKVEQKHRYYQLENLNFVHVRDQEDWKIQWKRWEDELAGKVIQDQVIQILDRKLILNLQDGWCVPPPSPPLPPKTLRSKSPAPLVDQECKSPAHTPDWGPSLPPLPRRSSSLKRSSSLPAGVSPLVKQQQKEYNGLINQKEGDQSLSSSLKPINMEGSAYLLNDEREDLEDLRSCLKPRSR